MKRLIIVLVLFAAGFAYYWYVWRTDVWIKDGRGVWVERGNPPTKPAEVRAQEDLLVRARYLHEARKAELDYSSGPCLGEVATDWVIDIVRSPRDAIDNLAQNQCEAYRNGDVGHLIEMTADGEVVKVK
ncbi:MAG: hypothetical protein AAB360_02140 [Patescibacteria group bacterium]